MHRTPNESAVHRTQTRGGRDIRLCLSRGYARTSAFIQTWRFLDTLDRIGKLAILIAVLAWLIGIPVRCEGQRNQRRAKISQAWQVINTAQGKPGSGGRAQAIYDLIDEGQSLVGADLSLGAYLPGLKIPGRDLRRVSLRAADLERADLSGTDLREADLEKANLAFADLSGAKLSGANLRDANVAGAKLSRASLYRAHLGAAGLQNADLSFADLSEVDLMGANLAGANLAGVNVAGAELSGANLAGADLGGLRANEAIWRKANLLRTNFHGAKNVPARFLVWAIQRRGAVSMPPATWKAMAADGSAVYKQWRRDWDAQNPAAKSTSRNSEDR